MEIVIVCLLAVASALCFVFAWVSNARYTRELNRLGGVYGCTRWPEETNRNYHTRLRARIWSAP